MPKNIKNIVKKILREEYNHMQDWFEFEGNNMYEILMSIKYKQKIEFSNKIKPNQYKMALNDFVKYGEFNRFPVKYIYAWKDLMLENVAMLYNLTQLNGHGASFPFDEFYDVFEIPEEEQDYDYIKASEDLDKKYHYDDYLPTFSNGQFLASDYGVDPLFKLGERLLGQTTPEDIIVTINKMLDIAHQRSDLAEIFIEGGSKSLDFISNENVLAMN